VKLKKKSITLSDIVKSDKSHKKLRYKSLTTIFETTVKKKRKLNKRTDRQYAHQIAKDVTVLFWKYLLMDLMDNKSAFPLPYNCFKLKIINEKKKNVPFCLLLSNKRNVRLSGSVHMFFEGELLRYALKKRDERQEYSYDQFDLNFY
jgi:hypothetical protein